jgi:hypothetical protein
VLHKAWRGFAIERQWRDGAAYRGMHSDDTSKDVAQAGVAYSLAFLNHYVKGDPANPQLTTKSPGVAVFRYASELGSS